ncbi:phytanoyl-CoA dioxygenase family protein [Streptomyces sp. NPDC001380]|uniref:phytanoyl-CoA dioxygenase family protein n=1 Tax=Streptomyces sp. NPDC001380 TaxID=3364566 RepID=UPI0036767BE8
MTGTTTPAPAGAAAAAPTSPFHLSDEEVRFFDENGYLVLRDRIPRDLVQRLAEASERWMADGRRAEAEGRNTGDHHFADRPSGRVLFRVDYLHGKGEPVSLELLGCPEVLGIAESLAGPNLVPTYESLVLKDEGDGAAVPWHQDAVHPRTHRIFNIDVYLDSSLAGGGALRVVPGSHRRRADVCALTDEHGWDVPGTVVVEMEPGDVLVHDVMVVHGSEPVLGNRLRRTVYYEFRAAEQILAEGPWDREWVDARLRLLPLALDRWAAVHPDGPRFPWSVDDALRPEPRGDAAAELRIVHGVHTPGSYCSAGDVPGGAADE